MDRYEIRCGRYGAYFYDKRSALHDTGDLTLKQVADKLNESEDRLVRLNEANEKLFQAQEKLRLKAIEKSSSWKVND